MTLVLFAVSHPPPLVVNGFQSTKGVRPGMPPSATRPPGTSPSAGSTALLRLPSTLARGSPHLLMLLCSEQLRAKFILPVAVHSGIAIVRKKGDPESSEQNDILFPFDGCEGFWFWNIVGALSLIPATSLRPSHSRISPWVELRSDHRSLFSIFYPVSFRPRFFPSTRFSSFFCLLRSSFFL